MAAVGFRLPDRVHGLSAEHAQFLAGRLRRRLTMPAEVAMLADEIWAQSLVDPKRETSRDIEPTEVQALALIEVMEKDRPPDSTPAWDGLLDALRAQVAQ